MNFTIIVMILGSLGFILLGTLLLNNKYIKNIDPKDSELYKEAKSISKEIRESIIFLKLPFIIFLLSFNVWISWS